MDTQRTMVRESTGGRLSTAKRSARAWRRAAVSGAVVIATVTACTHVHVGNGGRIVHDQDVEVYDQAALDKLARFESEFDKLLFQFQGRVSTVHQVLNELSGAASIDVEDALELLAALEGAGAAAEAASALADASEDAGGSDGSGDTGGTEGSGGEEAGEDGGGESKDPPPVKQSLAAVQARIDKLRELLINKGAFSEALFRKSFPSDLVDNPQRVLSSFADMQDSLRRERMRLLRDVSEFGPKGERRRYFYRVPFHLSPHLNSLTDQDVSGTVRVTLKAVEGDSIVARDVIFHEVSPNALVNRRQADAAVRQQVALGVNLAATYKNSDVGVGSESLSNYENDIANIDREKAAVAFVGENCGAPYFGYRVHAITQITSRFLLSPALLLSYLTSTPEYRTTVHQAIDTEGFKCDLLLSVPAGAFATTDEIVLDLNTETTWSNEGGGTLLLGWIPFLNVRAPLANLLSFMEHDRMRIRLTKPPKRYDNYETDLEDRFPRPEPLAIVESPGVGQLVVVPGARIDASAALIGWFDGVTNPGDKGKDGIRLTLGALQGDVTFRLPALPEKLQGLENRTHRLNVAIVHNGRVTQLGYVLYHVEKVPEPPKPPAAGKPDLAAELKQAVGDLEGLAKAYASSAELLEDLPPSPQKVAFKASGVTFRVVLAGVIAFAKGGNTPVSVDAVKLAFSQAHQATDALWLAYTETPPNPVKLQTPMGVALGGTLHSLATLRDKALLVLKTKADVDAAAKKKT